MGTVSYSVWIEATPEQVWRVYVDPSRIPEWQTGSPTIDEVQGSGDQPGSSYVSRRRPGAARTTVMEVDKPRRLMMATEAYFGLRFDVTSLLKSQSGGTLLKLRAETYWPEDSVCSGSWSKRRSSARARVKRSLLGSSDSSRATPRPKSRRALPSALEPRLCGRTLRRDGAATTSAFTLPSRTNGAAPATPTQAASTRAARRPRT